MALTDRKVLTFDVVGTLIDFEPGILDYVQARAKAAGVKRTDQAILETYAAAEDRQLVILAGAKLGATRLIDNLEVVRG